MSKETPPVLPRNKSGARIPISIPLSVSGSGFHPLEGRIRASATGTLLNPPYREKHRCEVFVAGVARTAEEQFPNSESSCLDSSSDAHQKPGSTSRGKLRVSGRGAVPKR